MKKALALVELALKIKTAIVHIKINNLSGEQAKAYMKEELLPILLENSKCPCPFGEPAKSEKSRAGRRARAIGDLTSVATAKARESSLADLRDNGSGNPQLIRMSEYRRVRATG